MNLYSEKQKVEVLDGKRWVKAETLWVICEAFDPDRHGSDQDDGQPEAWMVELRNGNRGGYDVDHMRLALVAALIVSECADWSRIARRSR